MYKFIWKRQFTDKKAFEKVKRAVVNANIESGGVNMISAKDMQKVFQINWVKKLINQTNSKWAMIPYNEFNQLGGEVSIFYSNLEFRDIKGLHLIKSVLWKSVLSTWVEVNSNENVVEDCIPFYKQEAQRLWNNNMISFKGKPLFFPQWVKAGIYKLGHLFNEEGEFLTTREISNIVGKSPSLWFEYNALLMLFLCNGRGNLMFLSLLYNHNTGTKI